MPTRVFQEVSLHLMSLHLGDATSLTGSRLVIHMFLHDTRASVALQKGALMSFAELSFSLPASRALFLANSATDWKSKYLEHRTPQVCDESPLLPETPISQVFRHDLGCRRSRNGGSVSYALSKDGADFCEVACPATTSRRST